MPISCDPDRMAMGDTHAKVGGGVFPHGNGDVGRYFTF